VVWQSIGQRYGLRTFGSRRGNILVDIELARTRPGELKAAKTPAVESDGKKKYPSSTRAHPPITEAEDGGRSGLDLPLASRSTQADIETG
jgi:hypothetical protein